MRAKFNVQLTKEDYVSGLSTVIVQLGLRDRGRNRRLLVQVGLWGLLCILLATLFPSAGLAVIVTFVAAALVTSWWVAWSARQTTGSSYDPATAAFTAEFSDVGINDRTADRVREWQWPAIRQVHDNGGVIVFELAGWDMLILPYRLWATDADRAEFVRQARTHLTTPLPAERPATVKDLFGRDQLYIGAIAAGIDAMFAVTYIVPPAYADTGIWVTIAGLLAGAVVAYLAYRVALHLLPRLHARAPRAAIWLTYALTAALPIFIVVAYFGWI